ncbi:hypothetical protein RhiirB3_453017 [Rhizophagus irregularis]|nr:hypothetical protein RhiirB3_453017 [Rhizophagus irregularis]
MDMVAGGLGLHQDQWSEIFGECWATSIIREGYIPEWSSTPPLKWTPISQRCYGNTDLDLFSHEISELLKIKAIQEMDLEEPCFVSNLFMVPKKDGRNRPCEIASATRRFYDFNRSQPSLLSRSCVDWIKKSGFHHKRGKIFFNTFSSSRLTRISDRFQVYDDKVTETQDQRFNTRMQKDKPKASNSGTQISFSYRKDHSNNGCCVSSQIAFSRTAKRQEHWSEDARLEWYYRTFPGKHRTIGMVDQEPTSMERTKSYSRGTKDNFIHRRFDLRMGRIPGGLCNTWKMAKNGTASSHQHSRVKSDFVRSTSLQGFKGPTDYDTHRQYNMRCLHKSSGRNDIYFTVEDSGGAMDSLSGAKCSLKSRTHPRNSEFNGGSSFSNEDRQIRLEVEDQLVQDVQSNLGTTSYRPLCKSPQHTTDKVLFLDTGSRSRGSECLSSELGTHEFVGQSSMDTYSENISQSNQKQGHDNDISTLLDVSTVVSTVVRPFDCPADFNSF